ncbi:mycofactocin biosynthesis chaperone MftB [Candidatus Neomicrothrix sp.]|uniref:mycofactocin biosynthesis chaperone MftB n=1 Tax=Candidatus Neomicrothrix sp. TaxID=2719034 RepID=UPI00257C4310|nr:mycofactocin biosynthesis chaperone MftB [Candidatus Microthrix sp.]HMS46235.1 mycofactocin biosynthesis chaperone MftB [Candidatus Microthrix sp.]
MRGVLIPADSVEVGVDVDGDADADPGVETEVDLDDAWALNPRVSLRPERFGALAYHFGNRRLSFLRHPDLVRVAEGLADADTVAEALRTAGVAEARWPSFQRALTTLAASDMVVRRPASNEVQPSGESDE